MLVSSAKSTNVPRFDEFAMSFMYRRKRRGPRTEPWGTPYLIIRLFFVLRNLAVVSYNLDEPKDFSK